MLNVETKIVGKKLIIEVDLSQEHGESASGKSIVIASSQGNQSVGYEDVKIGLNVYRPVKKGAKK